MGAIQRRHLRKDEIKEMIKSFPPGLEDLKQTKNVEIIETDDAKIILFNQEPILFSHEEKLLPLLTSSVVTKLPKVVIDMGAVPHIANGADVMAPGVVSADESIALGQAVTVVDERHGRELAVGIALIPGREMKGKSGKVVKTIHHIGDKIWKLARSLKS
ncbi:MAG: DUF1947 domain-containing protein [Candidatus Hadarchaeales archaeon]